MRRLQREQLDERADLIIHQVRRLYGDPAAHVGKGVRTALRKWVVAQIHMTFREGAIYALDEARQQVRVRSHKFRLRPGSSPR